MKPRPIRPVQVTVRPLSRTTTQLDPVFNVPVDQAGHPTRPTYGAAITFRAQVNFNTYKAPRVQLEGDKPATSGMLTIMAEDLPAADLRDARLEAVAGVPVDLIIKEMKPGGWSAGGKATLYRGQLQEADNALS